MMNDKHFETLMQQGRQKTDAAFHRAVEDALSKAHGRRRRMKVSSLAAAVLAAALGLSAAAATIYGSVFASMKSASIFFNDHTSLSASLLNHPGRRGKGPVFPDHLPPVFFTV